MADWTEYAAKNPNCLTPAQAEAKAVARSDGEREREIRESIAELEDNRFTMAAALKVSDVRFLLSLVDDLREQLGRAQALANTLEDALHPFGEFAVCYDAKPMLGRGDTIYAIHTGTPWESQLTFTDCRKAAKVLGYAAVARETTP